MPGFSIALGFLNTALPNQFGGVYIFLIPVLQLVAMCNEQVTTPRHATYRFEQAAGILKHGHYNSVLRTSSLTHQEGSKSHRLENSADVL